MTHKHNLKKSQVAKEYIQYYNLYMHKTLLYVDSIDTYEKYEMHARDK